MAGEPILNIKIKQEKPSPEREKPKDDRDEIDKILDSRPFSEDDEKKNVEPAKTSDELLEELFGVIGANVKPDEIFNGNDKKKKKKKRKHSDEDDDDERSSRKLKKVKKEKKIKEERDSEDELLRKIKKEKKDKEREKDKHSEKRKLSIVIKDLKLTSTVTKPSLSRDKDKSEERKRKSRDRSEEKKKKKHDKERSRDKSRDKKSRDKKSSSDISLSDEDTYRNFYEYHTSSRWNYDYPVREWDRDKHRDRDRDRRRDDRYYDSRSRYRRCSRSRSRSKSRRRSPIDKKRLLEIARKNAISMLKSGVLPRISTNTKEKLMAKIRHGGKTIEELTNYCKKLSRAEDLGELSELSDSDGESLFRPFHHPFEVKDRGPIVMNIKNSIPIAPKPASELKAIMAQFPVSSGKQHQMVENAWIPVKSTNPSTSTTSTTTTTSALSKTTTSLTKQIQEQLPELAKPKPPLPAVDINPALQRPYDWKSDEHYCKDIIPALAPPPAPPVDVSEIISQRLNAMRKLQENPTDNEASKILIETQQNMSAWAASKYTPGQFMGSTDVRVLSQKELSAGSQAWAKKTQLIDTAPVTSGMGMHLLRKMGWEPGEGLGKEKNGSLEPLLLELKFDKRGLEANEEILRQQKGGGGGIKGKKGGPKGKPEPISMESLQQKHPVSLLGELASKRRWGAPNYILVSERGPAHAKNFIFKVKLNGIEYTCPNPANNKKEAKAVAARFCLKELGILP
ncbi:hypothetical protein PVAND_004564 [Polypedilum vanderplanki]|uniref:Protein SON n=1 Tax=Polypedilum vanderplanki TaxID=319348 RepID=A0A9J6BXY8_POLVA|nr:hypothetical protein PVAND_004564 [Polypedilum vanderplanki]